MEDYSDDPELTIGKGRSALRAIEKLIRTGRLNVGGLGDCEADNLADLVGLVTDQLERGEQQVIELRDQIHNARRARQVA